MIKIPEENHYSELRREMVEAQLIPRGINDKAVLDAFYNVPREIFLCGNQEAAYEDCPLPTMCGQTISQPYIVAYMTELLGLSAASERCKVLEIGAGSGYQAAILAYMGCDVITLEKIPELAEFAIANLSKLPCGNKVKVIVGDGCDGCPEEAPFDGIIVTAAAPKIPKALKEQLREGGRIVIPCGDLFIQQMIQAEKKPGGKFEIHKGIGCRFVPLRGKDGFQE